jgi:uncharacterized membrane protein (DUF2068 family)
MQGDTQHGPRRIDGLRLIGLFKIGKAVLLLATTYGIYKLLDASLLDKLHEWVYSLTDSVERRLLERGLDWISSLGHARIASIVVVTSIYTAVLLTEGIGLWYRQRWAEWLTTLATASLIPFEIMKFFDAESHHHWAVAGTLLINISIVAYLVHYLRKSRKHREGA